MDFFGVPQVAHLFDTAGAHLILRRSHLEDAAVRRSLGALRRGQASSSGCNSVRRTGCSCSRETLLRHPTGTLCELRSRATEGHHRDAPTRVPVATATRALRTRPSAAAAQRADVMSHPTGRDCRVRAPRGTPRTSRLGKSLRPKDHSAAVTGWSDVHPRMF